MYFSGIADEAAGDLAGQVRAHQALQWKHIELRNIDGTNLTDLPDAEFDRVAEEVQDADLHVSCFASQIANWSRPIDTDLEIDLAELERAIPRMQRLGTPFIRCMSYPNSDPALEEGEWRERVVERMKRLAQLAQDGGVVLVHENCDGWGGIGPDQTMALLREVDSPALKLVFDSGNPVPHGQDGWEYYTGVRDEVVYVHIKDYRLEGDGDERREVACFPGEGRGAVREIITDLLGRGYDDGFSIEPHITSVIHLSQEAPDPELAFQTYVEYGQKLEELVRDIRQNRERG